MYVQLAKYICISVDGSNIQYKNIHTTIYI